MPVLVNFAVEPRFAGSGSSHQFFFFAMTEFYQTQGAGPEARRCCFRAALPVLWGVRRGKETLLTEKRSNLTFLGYHDHTMLYNGLRTSCVGRHR